MQAPTDAELALQRKYELLRKKKEEKARLLEQKQHEQQEQHKAPVLVAKPGQVHRAGATAARHTPAASTPVPKPAAESLKPLSAHEKALQALRAAKGGAGARAGIGQLSRKRAAAEGTISHADTANGAHPSAPDPPAGPAAAAPPRAEAEAAQAKADTVALAKQALAAKASQAAAAAPDRRKQPGLRRPAAQRPAGAATGGVAPADASPQEPDQAAAPEHAAKRQRTEPAGTSGRDAPLAAQLFVGDLPPGADAAALRALFGQVAPVTGARVPPGAAYGFVSFAGEEDAAFALQVAETDGVHTPGGQRLRVSRAGAPRADHRQGVPAEERAARYVGYEGGQHEHPKVREARLAGRSLAEQIQQGHLPGMDCGPPPERALVCYDDL